LATIFPLAGTTAIPTLDENQSATFSVGFVPGKAGEQSAIARIEYTAVDSEGSPTPRSTGVALSGEGIDRFIDASPRALNFGSHRIGAPAPSKTVTVYDDGSSLLRITDVAIVGPHAEDFTVRPRGAQTISESSPLRLTVGFSPSGVGARTARLRIRSDACTDPVVEIALAGSGVSQDVIALPSEIDLGVIEPGARAVESVAIANQGGAVLVVRSIRLVEEDSDVFVLLDVPDDLPRTLSPGAALSLRVRISAPTLTASATPDGSPEDARVFEATLRVESNDGDSPILRVPIRATVQEPAEVVSPTPAVSPSQDLTPSPSPVAAGPSIADFGAEARVVALVLAFFALLLGVRKLRGAPD
jgi:hypothetical protein